MIFLLSVVGTQSRFNTINRVAREKAQAGNDRDQYISDLTIYNSAVNARALCVDGVSRADSNREQWRELADFIAALDGGNGKAIQFAAQIRLGPVLSNPPRTIDECPVVPPKPVAPDAIAEQLGQDLPTTVENP